MVEGRDYDIYFRSARWPLAEGCEPFVAGALLPAMSLGAALRLPGTVSQRLLDHMPSYQNTISSWYDGFQVVPIEAMPRPAAYPVAGRGVGCFFSAGVDSFYSAAAHRDEITHLIFLRGFETPLRRSVRDEHAVAGVRAAAAEIGKPLIEIETNVRDLLDLYADWGYQGNGAVLGAVALLLAPLLRKVYIASAHPYQNTSFWGSHPALDLLWSSDEVEVIHDGSRVDRLDKLRKITGDPLAMRRLRVCSEYRVDAYNCGTCEKCLRTTMQLFAIGMLERCATLPHVLDYDLIARTSPGYSKRYSRERLLREVGGQERFRELQGALEQALGAHSADTGSGPMTVDAALDAARGRSQILQRQLRHIYESRSWRWTRPLRQLGRVLHTRR
jgi:hypothetical protein